MTLDGKLDGKLGGKSEDGSLAGRICGLILAGGQARRFGSDKRLADLGGRPLIDHAIGRLQPQVDELALSCNDTLADWAHLTHLADPQPAMGPLLGIAGGLAYAADEGFDWLVTAPADSPFLPPDLVNRLVRPGGEGVRESGIAFAHSLGRTHPVFGAWPTALAPALRAEIARGERKIDRAAAISPAPIRTVEWDVRDGDSFFNINRAEDLATAQARI